MAIKFLKDLANKPYEVRYRIFWFVMAAALVVVVAVWLLLIKNYNFDKELNNSNFKLPSFNEILPPNLLNQYNNIGNNFNSNDSILNNIGNNDMPPGNDFKSENVYIN